MRKHARNLVKLIRKYCKTDSVIHGCEVGVDRGHTTIGLLETFPTLFLHAVDPWCSGGNHTTMPRDDEELLQARKEFFDSAVKWLGQRLRVHEVDSVKATSNVANSSMDFIFIDACHLYEYVKQDLELWFPKVTPGGLVSGHDYQSAGDRRGLFGVKRAVDEWCGKNGYKVNVAPGSVWWFIK
jgi:predicted O-methyltransferase YrrM